MDRSWKAMSPFVDAILWSLQGSACHRYDQSNDIAVTAARQVLRNVEYRDDKSRRSLYAAWLREYASMTCQESFDTLMLNCVAATPSLSNPGTPIFADVFKVDDRIDAESRRKPVLNPDSLPRLFVPCPEEIEPLPSSPAFVRYLADLIRNSLTSQEALDEACMVIAFSSLALCLVVAKSLQVVQEFFRTLRKTTLTTSVPTSFDGHVSGSSSVFLNHIKFHSHLGVVEPFIVPLIFGQYVYHINAKEATHRLWSPAFSGDTRGARH